MAVVLPTTLPFAPTAVLSNRILAKNLRIRAAAPSRFSKIRCASWTSYGGGSFHICVSPNLRTRLEYPELSSRPSVPPSARPSPKCKLPFLHFVLQRNPAWTMLRSLSSPCGTFRSSRTFSTRYFKFQSHHGRVGYLNCMVGQSPNWSSDVPPARPKNVT